MRGGSGQGVVLIRHVNKVEIRTWLPVESKVWLGKVASRKGQSMSAYLRQIICEMQARDEERRAA